MKHFIPLRTTAFRKQLPLQNYYSLQIFQNLVTITVLQLRLWIDLQNESWKTVNSTSSTLRENILWVYSKHQVPSLMLLLLFSHTQSYWRLHRHSKTIPEALWVPGAGGEFPVTHCIKLGHSHTGLSPEKAEVLQSYGSLVLLQAKSKGKKLLEKISERYYQHS